MVDVEDDRLGVNIYEPTTEAELAVHVKKVQDVCRWFDEALVGGPAGKLRKYPRILSLTGPAGTAKTATICVFARELDCELLEWRNVVVESTSNLFDDGGHQSYNSNQESLLSRFEAFPSTCQPIFRHRERHQAFVFAILVLDGSSRRAKATDYSAGRPPEHPARHRAITIPRCAAGDRYVALDQSCSYCHHCERCGIRGEASDEQSANGSWGKDRDSVLDPRTILPKDLLYGPYVTQIAFNPIAPTLVKKALQALISVHFSSSKSSRSALSKEMLDTIIETSNGDIRSAIMVLQFSCVGTVPDKRRKKSSSSGLKLVLEAVTRREQSLHLFHLIGKVLCNKHRQPSWPFIHFIWIDDGLSGKGAPSNPSASAKDIQGSTLKDPPQLPSHLSDHARRTSRVSVDLLYADSPIDSSLFSLYISQFCNEVEECDGAAN
ncbi:Rad17 cell cycle checkpoint protein-domain-containing protein [Mycena sanguinolenta]|nr:Rad17 cell cycle checkpoint protein-domain-containing protein [Mycena sanguinolenta]